MISSHTPLKTLKLLIIFISVIAIVPSVVSANDYDVEITSASGPEGTTPMEFTVTVTPDTTWDGGDKVYVYYDSSGVTATESPAAGADFTSIDGGL